MDIPVPETPDRSYEDRFGRVKRRAERVARWYRWRRGGRRILVETRWRLGDEIMALPIYDALHKQFPTADIGAWCNYPGLLVDHPHVRTVTPEDFHPDRYILLRGAPRHVPRIEHYAAQARVPVPGDPPRLRYTDWTPSLPLPDTPYVALAPGASWPTKRWPVERWRALTDALAERAGHVVVLGNAGEGIGAGVGLTGITSVRDAACLLHHAKAVVSSDSGLMHLALAAGTRVVALFGPTDPGILVRPTPNLVTIRNDRPCFACWNRSQAMTEPGACPRRIDLCLDTIDVDTVANAVLALIEGP